MFAAARRTLPLGQVTLRIFLASLSSLVLLSGVGFLFPFAWPGRGINIFNLLLVVAGTALVAFSGAWLLRSFGLPIACLGVVLANWCVVILWLLLVLFATARFGPASEQPMA